MIQQTPVDFIGATRTLESCAAGRGFATRGPAGRPAAARVGRPTTPACSVAVWSSGLRSLLLEEAQERLERRRRAAVVVRLVGQLEEFLRSRRRLVNALPHLERDQPVGP